MQAIIDFLSSIAEGIINLFDIIFTLLRDLVDIIGLLIKVPEYLGRFMGWIPSDLFACMALLLAIVTLYKIMGRD